MARNDPSKTQQQRGVPSGVLSEAIRNVQRYTGGDSLQNVQGNGDFGPSIQFDSKGVDFGPWLRRFKAQIYRNWDVPYAAMLMHGHVVLSFNVHRDGSITDLQVLKPSPIDAFTKSAVNAIRGCNPTMPLPPEYPDDKALFTVTFYFNEFPPS
jgi:TonB family protein